MNYKSTLHLVLVGVGAGLALAGGGLARGKPTPAAAADFKLGAALRQLLADQKSNAPAKLSESARSLGISLNDHKVEVRVLAGFGVALSEIAQIVSRNGGSGVAWLGNSVYTEVPLDRLRGLAGEAAVAFVDAQELFYPAAAPEAGSAAAEPDLQLAGIVGLHLAGYRGKGMTIGIIDVGFDGAEEMARSGHLAPIAPDDVGVFNRCQARIGCFDEKTRTLERRHGTACAEIVHRVAPDARILYAAVGREGRYILQAVDWLLSRGVDAIDFSLGTHMDRNDGKSDFDRYLVAGVQGKGVLWVSAAGDEGVSHYLLTARKRSRDGFLVVPSLESGDRLISITPAPGATSLQVTVSWDDWDTPANRRNDIDAFLYEQPNLKSGKLHEIASGKLAQEGAFDKPLELVRFFAVRPGTSYYLGLKAKRLLRPVKVHVYADGFAKLEPSTAASTVMVPATAPLAIAVGAFDVTTSRLEAFSSQGPTGDGRIKPDVAATDNLTVHTLGGKQFLGTSAACATVAGFAVLLKEMRLKQNPGNLDVEGLRQDVIRHTRALGPGTPNPQSGYGLIDANAIPGEQRPAPAVVTALSQPGTSPGDSELGLQIALGRTGNPPVYHPGDGIKIALQSSAGCFYALFATNQGGYQLVAPKPGDPDRLSAGKPLVVPARGMEPMIVSEPLGMRSFVVICATQPIAHLEDGVDIEKRERMAGGRAVAEVQYEVRK